MAGAASSLSGVQCLTVKSLYLAPFHPGFEKLTLQLHQKMDCDLYLPLTKEPQADAARAAADVPGYIPRKVCAPPPTPPHSAVSRGHGGTGRVM